ncbi:expansin family protein [Pholiota molesta]|nr:expansin family protein [Pholiota molesta]
MTRVALSIFAFFAYIALVFAAPVPVVDGELVQLERRITHTGRGTWFYPGLGNCGWHNTQNDLILAIGKGLYDENNGSNCGQYVQITNTKNGKTAYGKTVDSCQSCSNNDIDMSPALFQKLSPLSTGQLTVQWHFMNRSWKP